MTTNTTLRLEGTISDDTRALLALADEAHHPSEADRTRIHARFVEHLLALGVTAIPAPPPRPVAHSGMTNARFLDVC